MDIKCVQLSYKSSMVKYIIEQSSSKYNRTEVEFVLENCNRILIIFKNKYLRKSIFKTRVEICSKEEDKKSINMHRINI